MAKRSSDVVSLEAERRKRDPELLVLEQQIEAIDWFCGLADDLLSKGVPGEKVVPLFPVFQELARRKEREMLRTLTRRVLEAG